MCTERERLVDYIYNECDAAERERMQQHLDSCHECRAEVKSLRSVREDLLAWDVPAHESVWRPFKPAPVLPFWRQVPAWTLAAAASLVLLSGAAGGAVLHAFMPDVKTPVQTQAVVTPDAIAPVLNTDLTPFERQVAELTQKLGAVDARVARNNTRTQLVSGIEGDHDVMVRRIGSLQEENKMLRDVIAMIDKNTEGVREEFDLKNAQLRQQVKELSALVAQLQLQLQLK